MSKFFDQYSSIIEGSLQQVRLRVDPHNKCAEDFAQYEGYIGYILAETDKNVDFYSNNKIITIPRKGFIFEGVLTGLAGTAPAGDTSRRTAVGTIARNVIGTAARVGAGIYGVNLPAGQQAPVGGGAAGAGAGIKLPASFDRSTGVKLVDASGIATLKANGASYGFTKITATNGSGLAIVPESFSQLLNFFTTLLEAAPTFTDAELDAAQKIIDDRHKQRAAANPGYVPNGSHVGLLQRELKVGYTKAAALQKALKDRKAAAANTPAPQTPPAPNTPAPNPQPTPANTPPSSNAPAPQSTPPAPQTPPAPNTPNAPQPPAPAAANSFIKTTQIMGNKAILSKEVDIMMSNMDPKAADKTPIVHKGVFTRLPNAADIIFTFLD